METSVSNCLIGENNKPLDSQFLRSASGSFLKQDWRGVSRRGFGGIIKYSYRPVSAPLSAVSDLEIFALQTGIERLLLGHSQSHKRLFKLDESKAVLIC